jgi:hypothetical protein
VGDTRFLPRASVTTLVYTVGKCRPVERLTSFKIFIAEQKTINHDFKKIATEFDFDRTID